MSAANCKILLDLTFQLKKETTTKLKEVQNICWMLMLGVKSCFSKQASLIGAYCPPSGAEQTWEVRSQREIIPDEKCQLPISHKSKQLNKRIDSKPFTWIKRICEENSKRFLSILFLEGPVSQLCFKWWTIQVAKREISIRHNPFWQRKQSLCWADGS